MASVDMAPYCHACHERHWPDTRHLGPVRSLLARLLRHR